MDLRDPSAEIVTESSRAFVVNAGPVRPIIEYPRSVIGKREYKFQSRWYDEFSWLEYSVTKDAAFCFYCRCFGTQGKMKLMICFLLKSFLSLFSISFLFRCHVARGQLEE